MMTRDPASGFPQIVGQIHQYLDFENLVKCRAVSKTWKQFLEEPEQRYIWIRAIDQDRKKYLDRYLDPDFKPFGNRNVCYRNNPMSLEERKADYDEWIGVLENVKENATIRQMIIICLLMKRTENTVESYRSFSPCKMLFYFYDCAFKDEDLLPLDTIFGINMNLFQAFTDLGLVEENSLVTENWNEIIECVVRSDHAKAVKFFVSKLMAVNNLKARKDLYWQPAKQYFKRIWNYLRGQ